jgi:adhesin/invasin
MGGLKRFMRNESGFTVVELVVAAAILFVVSTGIMGVLAYASTSNASDARHQMGLELANQRMEQARNMSYDDLGTTNNYPTGTIITPETVVLSTPQGNATYIVATEVDYSEDVTDPALGASKDIRITVSWTTPRPGSVTVESNIAGAPAVTNAGAVEILVQDSDSSDPVAGAVITIKPAGGFSASKTTGSDGYAKWKRVATGSIVITGTCSTHYLDMSPVASAVINNKQTLSATVQGERASSGTVHVVDQNGNDLPGVAVTIKGPLGYASWSCPTAAGGTLVSDSNGNAVFPLLRKGNHTVTGVLAGYAMQTSPSPDFTVISGGGAYSSVLTMNIRTTIKVKVVDASNNPVVGATVAATGPSAVTFASLTDTNGEATSNDMGAIGTGKTYTVTAAKAGYLGASGTVTMSQYSQGLLTLTLAPQPATTIKVTVRDASNNPIPGVTLTATGPSGVTFPSVTDASGQATSNDMGAIGSGKTYTVTASKSGWTSNTGSVTLSQYTQGTVTITLSSAPVNGTLQATYTSSIGTGKTIYVYSSNVANGVHIASQNVTSGSPTASFSLPAGTYWVSRRTPYGSSGAVPVSVVITSGNTTSVNITSSN